MTIILSMETRRMRLNPISPLQAPVTRGLGRVCSILALMTCVAIGGARAADQGPRNHARGEYDSATATYVVAAGDDLSSISERFGIPLQTLKTENKLGAEAIQPGDTLVLAAAGAPAARADKEPGCEPDCEQGDAPSPLGPGFDRDPDRQAGVQRRRAKRRDRPDGLRHARLHPCLERLQQQLPRRLGTGDRQGHARASARGTTTSSSSRN